RRAGAAGGTHFVTGAGGVYAGQPVTGTRQASRAGHGRVPCTNGGATFRCRHLRIVSCRPGTAGLVIPGDAHWRVTGYSHVLSPAQEWSPWIRAPQWNGQKSSIAPLA